MNIRRLIATISTVAIFSTLVVSTASATSAYSDVQDGQWYSDGIQAVVDAGAGPTGDKYEPAKLMTRAEAARYAVLLAGYTVPAVTTAPFSDVPVTHADAKYIAFAKDKGILGGYDTGKFGPNDPLTREQYAKMTVLAFELPLVNPTTASFSDVKSTAWSYKYVETAKSYGIITGYPDNTFKPAKNIQRDEGAVMVFRATSAGSSEGEGEVPPVTGGDLGVALSDETPAAATLPALATSTAVMAVDLTAGDTDVTFNGFTVHKKGVGAIANDFQAYLYDGNDRLTSGKSINSSTNNIEFSNVGFVVDAGETKTVTLKVDVGTTASGSVFFELVDADSVKSTADAVTGDFPVVSEEVGLSTTTVGSITIAKNGSVTNPKVGEVGATVAKFKLTAATEAAEVSELGLYITGTITATDVTNLKLYVTGTTEPLAEVDGVNGKDLAQFVFDTPYEIEKGGTKSFYVTADMEPGRNNDTLRIYIDEKTDIVAIGGTYGYGMAVTYTSYENSAADGTDASWSTLEGGDITFVSSGPSAADFAVNAKDVHLLNFTIAAVNDVTFKNFEVGMLASVEAAAAGGLLNSTTANFTDIKVVNTETGETLMGPVDVTSFKTATGGATAITEAAGDNAQAYYLFTDEFSMDAGETLKLALTTDVANNTSLNNETLVASLQLGATYPQVKDVNNKTLTNTSSLVPSSAITGKTMTVKSPSLTLSLASTPASKTYVKGYKGVKFAGISLACGSASTCKVTDLALTGYIDDDSDGTYQAGCQTVAGDASSHATCLSTYVGSVSLQDSAGKVLAASKSVQSTGAVNYTNLTGTDWTLAAGETKTVYVVGDLSSNSYANTDAERIYFSVAATTDVTAEDADGNSIASITGTPNSGTTVVATTAAGGVLTASVDTSGPRENILLAGAADQSIVKLKFTTANEAFVIRKLAIENRQQGFADANIGDNDDNISSIKISYTNSSGVTETKTGTLTKGNAEFSGMDFPVAADDDATMTVSATLNTISGGADAGTFVDLNLALENFEAVAQGSGATYKADALDATTVATGAYLSVGTVTWTDADSFNLDGAQTITTTLGGSATLTIDAAGTAPSQLPVGTLLCVEDAHTCGTDANIFVVTSWTAGTTEDTVVATMIDDAAGDLAFSDNADVSYSLPGTGYLATSKRAHIYETKPVVALNSGSPSGSRSVSTSDNAFIFDVTAGSAEKVQIRTGLSLATCALGFDAGNNGDSTVAATSTTAAIDGSDCLLTQGTAAAADSISFDAGAVSTINQYTRVSFWIRPSAITPEFADLIYGTDAAAGAGADGAIDNSTALASTDCGLPSSTTNMVASTWYHCDVAVHASTTTERYFHIGFADVTEFANGTTLTVDQVVLYNDKITVDLTGDDIDTYANMQTSAAYGTVTATLKDGSDTLATGYVYKTGTNAEGTAVSVTFVPISGTDAAIEVSKGTTKTLTVQLSTSALLAEDAGADDPLTFSMDMGTSASGTVTAGDFWWNDTNFSNATVGSEPGAAYALTTPGVIKWLGQVSNTTLNSNTVKY